MALKENNPEPRPGWSPKWRLISRQRDAKLRPESKQPVRAPDVSPTPNEFDSPFDAGYLRRLKERDPETGKAFDSHFRKSLRLKLRGRGLQQSDVDSIIQETLLRVLKGADKEEIHTPIAFGGYVSRVCDFVYFEWLKHYKRRYEPYIDVAEIDILDPAPGQDILLLRRERRKLVAMVLSSLRPKDRNLLRDKLFNELTNEEMCERHGVSSDNLRTLLCRARKKFADAWKKQN